METKKRLGQKEAITAWDFRNTLTPYDCLQAKARMRWRPAFTFSGMNRYAQN